jgi:hypothetical protein
MRFTDYLDDVGRAVAYYPNMARALGTIEAAIFFAQLFYWQDKCGDEELGVYKTKEDWQEETGLSFKEQDRAIARLEHFGLLERSYKRIEHRMYYKLHMDSVNDFWDSYLDHGSTAPPKRRPKSL